MVLETRRPNCLLSGRDNSGFSSGLLKSIILCEELSSLGCPVSRGEVVLQEPALHRRRVWHVSWIGRWWNDSRVILLQLVLTAQMLQSSFIFQYVYLNRHPSTCPKCVCLIS